MPSDPPAAPAPLVAPASAPAPLAVAVRLERVDSSRYRVEATVLITMEMPQRDLAGEHVGGTGLLLLGEAAAPGAPGAIAFLTEQLSALQQSAEQALRERDDALDALAQMRTAVAARPAATEPPGA